LSPLTTRALSRIRALLRRPGLADVTVGDAPGAGARVAADARRRTAARRDGVGVGVRADRHLAAVGDLLCRDRRDHVRLDALAVPGGLVRQDTVIGDRELRAGVVWILRIGALNGQLHGSPVPVVDLDADAGKLREVPGDDERRASRLDDLLTRGEDADGVAVGA